MARVLCVAVVVACLAACQRPAGEQPGVDGGGSAACGNGVLDPGEVCDDGNTVSGDGCSADCKSDETCGNGVVDPGELCDDGNTVGGDGCSADCKSDETCGNGVVDTDVGETCDDGNTVSGDGCSATCQLSDLCGNGVVDAGEQCDPGGNVATTGCDPDCTFPVCGDGVVNKAAGEQCDDGNTSDADSCTHKCTISRCGDGILDPLTEECDDGNTNNADGCQNTCKLGPPNDFAVNAIDISAGGTFTVDLTHAHDDIQSSCNDPGNGRDVFYTFTLATEEVIYFDTFGSTFDTTLALYPGSCTARGSEIVCDDDDCNTVQSQLGWGLGSGQYCLVLDTNTPSSGAGPATLVMRHGGHTGDFITFGAAQVVTGDTTTNYDQMQGTCADAKGSPDYGYWFATCPGEVVDVTADTCTDLKFDTVLYLRSALALGSDVACNDDTCGNGSTISGQVSGPADVHWILVDGQGGSGGAFTLTYTVQDH